MTLVTQNTFCKNNAIPRLAGFTHWTIGTLFSLTDSSFTTYLANLFPYADDSYSDTYRVLEVGWNFLIELPVALLIANATIIALVPCLQALNANFPWPQGCFAVLTFADIFSCQRTKIVRCILDLTNADGRHTSVAAFTQFLCSPRHSRFSWFHL